MSQVNIPKDNPDPFYRYRRPILSVKPGKANTTILTNIDDVAKAIARSPREIVSYFKTSLGTSGNDNSLKGSFSSAQLEDLLEEFIEENVLCPTCGNPETFFDKKGNMNCKACGL